eukprot:3756700-Karenia_brevis.AAC.1
MQLVPTLPFWSSACLPASDPLSGHFVTSLQKGEAKLFGALDYGDDPDSVPFLQWLHTYDKYDARAAFQIINGAGQKHEPPPLPNA